MAHRSVPLSPIVPHCPQSKTLSCSVAAYGQTQTGLERSLAFSCTHSPHQRSSNDGEEIGQQKCHQGLLVGRYWPVLETGQLQEQGRDGLPIGSTGEAPF